LNLPELPPGAPPTAKQRLEAEGAPVSLRAILKENPFLVKMVIFFVLMLFVPLALAWKFGWFLVAN
jgi:hypothetical protein